MKSLYFYSVPVPEAVGRRHRFRNIACLRICRKAGRNVEAQDFRRIIIQAKRRDDRFPFDKPIYDKVFTTSGLLFSLL